MVRGSRKDFGQVVKVWDRRCEVKRGERDRLPSWWGRLDRFKEITGGYLC